MVRCGTEIPLSPSLFSHVVLFSHVRFPAHARMTDWRVFYKVIISYIFNLAMSSGHLPWVPPSSERSRQLCERHAGIISADILRHFHQLLIAMYPHVFSSSGTVGKYDRWRFQRKFSRSCFLMFWGEIPTCTIWKNYSDGAYSCFKHELYELLCWRDFTFSF